MPIDTKEILYCPACNTQMQKVFIKSANCYVDICTDGCGGILFDNRELEKFDEEYESIDEILCAYKDKKYEKVNCEEKRVCPVCSSIMVKQGSSCLDSSFEIDVCYCCGAKFLDYGELEKLRAEYKTEEERSKSFNNYFVELMKNW